VVIDPKWTPMVAYADLWLRPRLGTDVALLNSMMHVIIREGLVDENSYKTGWKGVWRHFGDWRN
jgi:anaerobic selenocysteine-containing dehydrogenase